MYANTIIFSFGTLLLVSAICVVLTNNTVFSLFFLILSFLFASCVLVCLEAEFLGLILIVIYVGAIAILFLFSVMMLETKLATIKKNNRTLTAPIGLIFGLMLLIPTIGVIETFSKSFQNFDKSSTFHTQDLADTYTEISNYGSILYSYYSTHLLITGMLLLVILLGIIRLTNVLLEKTKHQSIYKQLSRTIRIFAADCGCDAVKELLSKMETKKKEEDSSSEVISTIETMAKEEDSSSEVISTIETMAKEEDSSSEVISTIETMAKEEDSFSEVISTIKTMAKEEDSFSEVISTIKTMAKEEDSFTTYFQPVKDIIPLKSFILFPEFLLGITIIYLLISGTWITRNNYGLIIQKPLSEIFGMVMLMLCYLYYNECIILLDASFYKSTLNGGIAKLSKFIICFISAIYFLSTASPLKEQKLTSPEYVTLVAFSMLGLLLVCSGNDLLTIYLALELTSLSSYILAAFKKTQHSSESGLKYFIVGSISSSFYLLGASILYLETNSIYLNDYSDIFFFTHKDKSQNINLNLIDVSISFIFLSLFIKLSCAPFHIWTLDVYEESPTNSSFFFAAITKLSLIIVLIRIAFYTFFKLCFVWVTLFTLIGIISAFIGALGGVRQKKLKTLLAYSSTSNMGYALIVLGGFTDAAVWAMLLHVIVYQISGLCIWSLFIITRLKLSTEKDKYNKELTDLSLLRKANFPLALAFTITLFSLAGIPPLLGFVPKIYIISEVIKCNYIIAAMFLALCSVIATFYYIRIIKVLFFENLLTGKLYYPMSNFYAITLSLLIHFLLNAFNDIRGLNILMIGDKSGYTLPWPVESGIAPQWLLYSAILAFLNSERRIAILLHKAGWVDPTNPNWFSEVIWILDDEKFWWTVISIKTLRHWMILDEFNTHFKVILDELELLNSLKNAEWVDPENPCCWYTEASYELWQEARYRRNRMIAKMIIHDCLPVGFAERYAF